MAAGKSPHALTNIGEGGQQGIATFAQLEKGRREDENRRYLSELHQKEVDLRERELKAREPLIEAQTAAQKALPEYRQQMNQVRADVARSHAQQMADKAFKDIMSNPMSPEFKAISADKTGTVAPAIKKKLEETYFGAKYKELMLQQQDGLGIKSVSQPSE
jgi:multidrug resistance efflux pump